jgi:HK97 family phage prohead protease
MELRAKDDGNTLTFTGYASVTDSPYEMEDFIGSYTETVSRGAFKKTLGEGADVPFKLNHDGMTLARTKSGTMRLAEDSTGLHVEADLDARNPVVVGIQSAMERGDLDEMSFAFRVTRQEWNDAYTERWINEVNLSKGDVSIVNYGANPHTGGLTNLRGLSDEDMARVQEYIASLRGTEEPQAPVQGDPLAFYRAKARLLDI